MPSSARVALITGCGKPIGIGNSTARALAKTGATVVVSDVVPTGVANEHNVEGDLDLSWGGVESLVQEIVRNGGSASSTLGDVSVEADAARMVEEVLRRYGRLDILVNNAGAPQGADRNEIEDVPVEAWDRTMGVNVRGAFLMSRAAVPAMRKAKWGRIIIVRPRQRSGRESGARPMPPRKRRSSVSQNHWRLTSRRSESPSTPSAPARSVPREPSAPTAGNTAKIWRSGSPNGQRPFQLAASGVPTRSPR